MFLDYNDCIHKRLPYPTLLYISYILHVIHVYCLGVLLLDLGSLAICDVIRRVYDENVAIVRYNVAIVNPYCLIYSRNINNNLLL